MSSSINHRPQDDDDVLSINRMLKHLNDINPGEVITYARVAANQILPTAVMSQARGLYLLGKVHLPQRVSHPTNARDEEVADQTARSPVIWA